MLPYLPLNFSPETVEQLRHYVLNDLAGIDVSGNVAKIDLPADLAHTVNQQLALNGLPNYRVCLLFEWLFDPVNPHVDGGVNTTTSCSVIVPISGCAKSMLYWMTGDYTVARKISWPGKDVHHWAVTWHKPGRVSHTLISTDTVHLCRVDIPHNVTRKGTDTRITLTFRLEGNPDFGDFI